MNERTKVGHLLSVYQCVWKVGDIIRMAETLWVISFQAGGLNPTFRIISAHGYTCLRSAIELRRWAVPISQIFRSGGEG